MMEKIMMNGQKREEASDEGRWSWYRGQEEEEDKEEFRDVQDLYIQSAETSAS